MPVDRIDAREARIRRAAILALALALSESAKAHDLDCHGMPFPEAEKLGCCGAGDAHFGNASQFYEDIDGFWHYLVAGEDFRLVHGTRALRGNRRVQGGKHRGREANQNLRRIGFRRSHQRGLMPAEIAISLSDLPSSRHSQLRHGFRAGRASPSPDRAPAATPGPDPRASGARRAGLRVVGGRRIARQGAPQSRAGALGRRGYRADAPDR
jgi:hypothetical protein